MARVDSRDLRNDTAGVLRRVSAGEDVIITVKGEPVAQLVPLHTERRRWLPRAELAARLAVAQADSDLPADLERIAGELTDDLRCRSPSAGCWTPRCSSRPRAIARWLSIGCPRSRRCRW